MLSLRCRVVASLDRRSRLVRQRWRNRGRTVKTWRIAVSSMSIDCRCYSCSFWFLVQYRDISTILDFQAGRMLGLWFQISLAAAVHGQLMGFMLSVHPDTKDSWISIPW